MNIRKSNKEDIQSIMKLINQAQCYFKKNNIDQWQDGYPNEMQINKDINHNGSYVLEDNKVIASMYFAIEDDINYTHIKGEWITNQQPYAVIHRIVVDENYKGNSFAKYLLDFAIDECKIHHIKSIRIDTHSDNISMQKFLKKNSFKFCGEITLENGNPRIAFEKIIE